MVYLGNRCFLKEGDNLREDTANYPSKSKDFSSSPTLKTTEYVDAANVQYEAAHTRKQRTDLVQKTGCKGAYALRKLPFHDRLLSTPVDPMHLIKNIVAHCVNLVAGNEDSYKVREEEKLRKRFPTSWIKDSREKLPLAPFVLPKDDIKLADDRAKRVLVPYGFDWQPRDIFSKTTGMKSHEWKQLACNGILKFCLRGMLGRKQRSTLFKLFDVLESICAEDILADSIDALEQQVHTVLALIERDFPVSMQVIVFHLLHHLPMYIKRFGPVYSFWMYHYERFNSWLTRRVLNRRYPEATVVATYRLCEWANFLELSGQFPEGTLSYIQRAESDVSPDIVQPTSTISLAEEVMEHVHFYYCAELPEYKKLTGQYQEEKGRARSAHQLRQFPKMSEWMPQYSLPLSSQQREMCSGPSINGVQLKRYTYKDCHGRRVVLGSAEFEYEHSYCRSSFVRDSQSVCVGRIVSLFQHTFLSTTTTFAYISWFDGPYLDTGSKLNFVLTSAQTQSVVPVSTLSKPLVIAMDDEELDKLWILNLKTN